MRRKATRIGLLAPFVLLTACGSSDPTPDPEDAAPAAAIEASVNRAENIADEAKEEAAQRNEAAAADR
jgi:hypothetical protein